MNLLLLLLSLGAVAAEYSGRMTYYTPDTPYLGACEWHNTKQQFVAAMNTAQFPGSCGKCVEIDYKGKKVKAKVVDECPVCEHGMLDVSPVVFETLEKKVIGIIHMKWRYVSCDFDINSASQAQGKRPRDDDSEPTEQPVRKKKTIKDEKKVEKEEVKPSNQEKENVPTRRKVKAHRKSKSEPEKQKMEKEMVKPLPEPPKKQEKKQPEKKIEEESVAVEIPPVAPPVPEATTAAPSLAPVVPPMPLDQPAPSHASTEAERPASQETNEQVQISQKIRSAILATDPIDRNRYLKLKALFDHDLHLSPIKDACLVAFKAQSAGISNEQFIGGLAN